MDSSPMKPKEQRQDQCESFMGGCTLEDVSRLLMSPTVTQRQTTGLTRERQMCWGKIACANDAPASDKPKKIHVFDSASYSHMSLLGGEKHTPPAFALFKTDPQHPKLCT